MADKNSSDIVSDNPSSDIYSSDKGGSVIYSVDMISDKSGFDKFNADMYFQT